MSTTRKLNIIAAPKLTTDAQAIFDSIYFNANYVVPEGQKSQRTDFIAQCVAAGLSKNTATTYHYNMMAVATGKGEQLKERQREAAKARRQRARGAATTFAQTEAVAAKVAESGTVKRRVRKEDAANNGTSAD